MDLYTIYPRFTKTIHLKVPPKETLTSFDIIRHHSTSFNIIQHHSTSFNIIQHHSTSFNIIQHHSTSFNIYTIFTSIKPWGGFGSSISHLWDPRSPGQRWSVRRPSADLPVERHLAPAPPGRNPGTAGGVQAQGVQLERGQKQLEWAKKEWEEEKREIPSGFIKHGWLENPRTEWRFW